jgi:phosphoenolpyruvate synthase/pyruvate phosphate dikinase
MAVLIQEAVPSESSGVMITANPFDSADKDSIFISAKRGLGIRVVDGQKVPEQIVFREDTNAVQILTRSQDDGRLVFAPDGGIRTVPTPPDLAVLSDPLIRRLAATGKAIQRLFGNRPQNIEWAIVGDQIYILQSRPYLKS